MCTRIYFGLIGENRSDVIESMMTKKQKKFMKVMKYYPSVLGLQYVLAWLFKKDAAKAETIENEFEKDGKDLCTYSQDIEFERNLIKMAEEKSAA